MYRGNSVTNIVRLHRVPLINMGVGWGNLSDGRHMSQVFERM